LSRRELVELIFANGYPALSKLLHMNLWPKWLRSLLFIDFKSALSKIFTNCVATSGIMARSLMSIRVKWDRMQEVKTCAAGEINTATRMQSRRIGDEKGRVRRVMLSLQIISRKARRWMGIESFWANSLRMYDLDSPARAAERDDEHVPSAIRRKPRPMVEVPTHSSCSPDHLKRELKVAEASDEWISTQRVGWIEVNSLC
jgi:hypothetical protein